MMDINILNESELFQGGPGKLVVSMADSTDLVTRVVSFLLLLSGSLDGERDPGVLPLSPRAYRVWSSDAVYSPQNRIVRYATED